MPPFASDSPVFEAKTTSYRGQHAWEESLASLAAYKAKHGHCRVKKRDGKLGRWVANQRARRGEAGRHGSTVEKVAQLDALKFVWKVPADGLTANWEEGFAGLVSFEAKHGHCGVKQQDGKLGTWVSNQRQSKKKLEVPVLEYAILVFQPGFWHVCSEAAVYLL